MPETPSAERSRQLSLRVLGFYVAASTVLHIWNAIDGHWDIRLAAVEVFLLVAVFARSESSHWVWRRLGDWLPLLALPLLYGGLEWSMLGRGMMHDAVVQGWDRALFGTDAARTMAGAMPWRPLSETLHLAYFSYYGIIYGPAFYLYMRRRVGAFRELVLAFTVAMVASFAVFTVFPVEGPRYAWPVPAVVPDGPIRSLVLWVLQGGSTRGTAFPSSHVAISIAIALAVFRRHRWAGVGLVVVTVLLGVGAVYGGFHYATDVVAGMALGLGSWGISKPVNRRSFEAGPED